MTVRSMAEDEIRAVPEAFAHGALVDAGAYTAGYRRSIEDGDAFWAEQADRYVDWFRRWDSVDDSDFPTARIAWFTGAKLNVAYNCLDRHLENHADRTAIIWEGDDPADIRRLSYRELHEQVSHFANALKGIGVKRGDRVCIYLTVVPEAAVAMLACARIGAIHSVVFGGFSPGALRDRIVDSGCSVVVTADHGMRGGRRLPLKANADLACDGLDSVKRMVVVRRAEPEDVGWTEGRDRWYHDLIQGASGDCTAVEMDAEDPLFILYTSGSTGRPKGIVHSSGGYLVYAAMTHDLVFDHHEGDVFWCNADIGWITGHTYAIYGPLTNGATSLLYEGIATWPDAGRLWQVIDRHAVTTFYTSPTTLRALMSRGDAPVQACSRDSLRLLGTVGEPINPGAWDWLHRVVGGSRCPVLDTWWQTETGGIVLAPLPGAIDLKPGAAAMPFFGIAASLVDDDGEAIEGPGSGRLVLTRSWPGQMRAFWGSPERFFEAYFREVPGCYSTGDSARRDEDGYWWITGHTEDMLTVGAEHFGTLGIESALVDHPAVAEAAVVAYTRPADDPRGGSGPLAWVTLMHGVEPNDALRDALIEHVRGQVGEAAVPDIVRWAPKLPKTRSGKILRRILRKIAAGDVDDLGDMSTLADPGAVDELVAASDSD